MLTKKTFQENLAVLSTNFNFEVDIIYKKIIFQALENKTTDEIFLEKINSLILNLKLEEWNKKYGYRGKPAGADWISFACPSRSYITCKPFNEFGIVRSARLETYEEAIKREKKYLTIEQ